MFKFKHLKEKVVRQMKKHRGAAIHWFQNGHPMKALITHHKEMLGVDEKSAGTQAKDKRPFFGNRGRRGTEAYTNYHGYVERKRSMKPPAKTLSNYGYRNFKGKDWRR